MEGIKSISFEKEVVIPSLRQKLESLPTLTSARMYRFPICKFINDPYTPRIVSIGPMHHGNTGLQSMEEYKLRNLQDFLLRTKVSLVDYIELVAEREAKLRNSYEETSNLSSDEFLAMILVDSAFVIESLLRFSSQSKANKDHGIFGKPLLEEDIWYDMLVLENQLPFFILEDLFVKAKIIIPPEQDERRSLIWLIHNAFKDKVLLAGIQELWEKLCCSKIEHFLHFVRICHLPQQLPLKREMKSNLLQCTKLALRVPSATQLRQAGVKFKVGLTGNIYDIKFKNGILEIPCLRICG
jgi:hypothetical protein